jgi:hypothetical protein
MGSAAVPGVKRGCNFRVEGAVYLEVGLGNGGKPLEFFLSDPPVPMTCDTKVGVELIERDGVTHVLDWVGEQHYPFAADALEEGRRYGFSRRVPRTLDLSRLTAASRILLVHARGLVTNHQALRPHMPDWYNDAYGTDSKRKPAHKHHCGHLERTSVPGHHKPQPHKHVCTRDLWAVPPATRVEDGTPPRYIREFASISYEVFPLSPDAPAPDYTSALVASLPITNVSVIKAGDGSHKKTLAKVKEMLSWEGGLRITVTEADA